MAVVIRLQGLPVVAGSGDIRRFFSGLDIPDGGVHIIGGEKGEAFIIFATDEDARQGMSFSGGFIKDSRIELFLSSKAEMQHIIDVNRKRSDHGGRESVTRSRRAGSSSSGVGNLSNLVAAIKKGIGKSSYGSLDHLEKNFHSDGSQNSDMEVSKSTFHQFKKGSFTSDSLYVFISGVPFSASEDDVLHFFSGLQVDEMVLLEKEDGRLSGEGMVKFATSSDAVKSLQRDKYYIGKRFITVRPSDRGRWLNYCRIRDDMTFKRFGQLNEENCSSREHISRRESSYISSRKQSPSRPLPRRVLARSHSRSPLRRSLARTHSRSPRRGLAHSHSRSPLRTAGTRFHSPVSHSTMSHSSNSKEFYIHIKNLSPAIEKRDLRVFFAAQDVPNHHITLLKSNNSHEKRKEAFVLFRSGHEYQSALRYHKQILLGQEVHLFPASKKSILEVIESSEMKRSSERHHHINEKKDGYSSQKICVYVRNFPFDVTKVEVQKFFAGFSIDDRDIHLLYDDKGIGLGEALVKFRSEEQAQKAESLNRRRFLGTEVLLRCIPEEQMQEFGITLSTVSSEKMQGDHAHSRGDHFYPVGSQGPSMSSQEPPVQGNLRHPTDYRCPDDFLCSPDQFRGPPVFPEFPDEANPGGFPEGRFMPDSNFSGGSDRITLIKLNNIPFRATHNEILDFFHGYKIIPESLSIHQNEYGMPSGEATLALLNYSEAVAAVNELNGRPFGHRKVRLTLA